MKLGLGLSLANRSGAGATSIPSAGLSLWLRADAGVTRRSFTYSTRITLSGADPTINGVYQTSSAPNNVSTKYIMNGPNGYKIDVTPTFNDNRKYRLFNEANYTYPNPWYYEFSSTNGSTWETTGKKPVSIVISGLIGTFVSSNGTYNAFEWSPENNSFQSYKKVQEGYDTGKVMEIFTNGLGGLYNIEAEFAVVAEKQNGWGIGAWDIAGGAGAPMGSGTLSPQGSPPAGAVETTTVVTNQVSAWLDQSPISNPVYAYSPEFNDNDVNGKPSLTLSGNYVSLGENPNIMGETGTTAFAAVYANDVCSDGDLSGPIFGNFGDTIGDDPASQGHYPYGPECAVYDAFATANRKNGLTPPVPITNAWTVYSVSSTNNDWRAYVNSVLMHSDIENVYNNQIGGLGDPRQLYIGFQNADGEYSFKGKIAEAIVYNRVLTTGERKKVETYLMDKYAITPPPAI
jgi:Concanavalin A-like lectin/glucanases superfamily